jgi:hypothetical protein
MAEALNVIVLADWQRCYRQQFWQDVLDLINQRSLAPPVVCRVYRLADELAIATSQRSAPDSSCTCEANLSEYAESSFVEELQKCQVLIVNWDAVNGDPDFGADITLRWFEVRRPEIWDWVEEKGGILLIEGQAIYSVRCSARARWWYPRPKTNSSHVLSFGGAAEHAGSRQQRGNHCLFATGNRSRPVSRMSLTNSYPTRPGVVSRSFSRAAIGARSTGAGFAKS